MTVYTFSEARQKFASILERARREGSVRVKRRDGQVFVIQPEPSAKSPFDVPGVDTDVSTEEIVDIIREMRERSYLPEPKRTIRKTKKRPIRTPR